MNIDDMVERAASELHPVLFGDELHRYELHYDNYGQEAWDEHRAAVRADIRKTLMAAFTTVPNSLLIVAPVLQEFEDEDWEHGQRGYWYSYIGDFQLVGDTVDDKCAVALSLEAENGDSFPDGVGTLDSQITKRFEPQREAFEQARDSQPDSLFNLGASS